MLYCSQGRIVVERLVTRVYDRRTAANLQKLVFLWETKILLCKAIDRSDIGLLEISCFVEKDYLILFR